MVVELKPTLTFMLITKTNWFIDPIKLFNVLETAPIPEVEALIQNQM